MNLAELRKHLRGTILRDKAATPSDRLWSNADLDLWLNEAQDQFARRTHCLSDSTSNFTELETVAGQASYKLDRRIIFVAEIVHSDGRPLAPLNKHNVPRSIVTGRPSRYTTDAGVTTLRLYPTPDAAYTLDLLVARRPKAKMVEDTDIPEIDEEFHLDLCSWVAYRALRVNDPDGGNMVASEPFRAEWELRVRDAKRGVFRLRSGAEPQVQAPSWTGKR